MAIEEMMGVQVRASSIHGKGVFATRVLPARRKLGELSGELVKLPQGRWDVESRERIYLVELSRRVGLDCTNGNAFKYLNHSCQPNCYLRVLRRSVEVYALREVQPGDELTVNYGETPHKGGMACSCRGGKCRGRL